MKKIAFATLAAVSLVLVGCGKTDKASEEASAENVEMPAEEAMSGVDASAAPVADASAAPGAEASAGASEAAPAASAAAEQATKAAEKKM